MRRTLLLAALVLSGCMSVNVPNYIKDEHPYKKTVYANFDETLKVTSKTLEEFGWTISGTSDPTVFERDKRVENQVIKQTLLFTDTRETKFFLGTRYSRINAFVRSSENNKSEIEIRYVTVTSLPLKSFSGYKKNAAVDRIFRHIDLLLSQP